MPPRISPPMTSVTSWTPKYILLNEMETKRNRAMVLIEILLLFRKINPQITTANWAWPLGKPKDGSIVSSQGSMFKALSGRGSSKKDLAKELIKALIKTNCGKTPYTFLSQNQ